VYSLRVGRGRKYLSNVRRVAGTVVGGWRLNDFPERLPLWIYVEDLGGLLDDFENRASLAGNPFRGFHDSMGQWFYTAAFVQPHAGVMGNAGRNIVRG